MIRAGWDVLLHISSTAPNWMLPMLSAVAMAVLMTQAIKPWLPAGLTKLQRHRITQLIAFGCGLSTSFVLWPAELHWKYGAVIGALVGLAAPAVYPVAMSIIGHRWPWLRERLSGDRLSGDRANPED